MLSFSAFNKKPEDKPAVENTPAKAPAAAHPLDALTGGAFSAPTSGERAARVREWLASQPSVEQMHEVFKELSHKDKGAAKPLKEKLDELKRTAGQEHIAAEWSEKAQGLLVATRFNIADALAWQRDAAKAGAPLSKEPLAALRAQLQERIKQIEELQHRAQVQREAAMMLAQRVELMSTKAWTEAVAARETAEQDVKEWQAEAKTLLAESQWPSVDAKFTPQIEAAQAQLATLWEAFSAALAQAVTASEDASAPLPAVPVWADAIRAARSGGEAPKTEKAAKPKIDPELRKAANAAVREQLTLLEKELAEGHGKATAQAANAVRAALKEHGAVIDDKLEAQTRDALGAAGELEGWQKWRANQIREELIAKAQALVAKPLGGRKQQEAVRGLREAWKQTDQGGMPNHGMWRKFDEACNEAHKIVEAWLEKVKAEEAQHKAERVALIAEVEQWTAANAARTDWKQVDRELHAYSEKWRGLGHIGEKAFAELQPQYKAAIKAAHGPLEVAQKASLDRRRALIDEAVQLGAAPMLRIDAVKALQARWQGEAQAVPLDRKEEQKLWDAFRKPIDEAFNRKSAAREAQAAAMSAHDKAVIDAAKALDEAIASGDAAKIRAAMQAVDQASRGKPVAPVSEPKQPSARMESAQGATETVAGESAAPVEAAVADAPVDTPAEAVAAEPSAEATASEAAPAEAAAEPAAKPIVAPKPVIARRGDDRPGAKKAEAVPAGRDARGGKFGDRRDGKRDDRFGDRRGDSRDGGRDGNRGADRFGERRGGFGGRDGFEDRGPRLSGAAFRTQREAIERAEGALKKLAAQAHGEVVVNLLSAWSARTPDAVPAAKELGKSVPPAARSAWTQALAKPAAAADVDTALLRLEMASGAPTPADQLDARRALQLKLLTQRNAAGPQETWAQDTATVLSAAHDEASARRLQNALKSLLR
jgi:ATP-dependent RNA helicase SUPV3L1/SUV3